jgi:hypothetical protein
MFRKPKPTIVVSEPDIQAALAHLRSLPFRANAPVSWCYPRCLNDIGKFQQYACRARRGICAEGVGVAPIEKENYGTQTNSPRRVD